MNHFHFWCTLKSGVDGREFCERVREFLSYLYERERIEGFNLARRQFGIDPPGLGEYHIQVDFRDSTQMSRTFDEVGARSGETEEFHKTVTECVKEMTVSLYRDWPDSVKRKRTAAAPVPPPPSPTEDPVKIPPFLGGEWRTDSQ